MKPGGRRLRVLSAALLAVLAAGSAGCGRTGGEAAGTGSITVAAAASLRGALTEIGRGFETTHPGTTVELSFDSSSTLADGIVAGAPADVFASADEVAMGAVADAGLVAGAPVAIARNRLAIVTRAGNPDGFATMADLAAAETVSLCARQAPCGRLTADVLARAGVDIPEDRVSRGQNAAATLTAVSEGDAAAAIVYVTDGLAAGDLVEVIAIPEADDATAVYPAAALVGSAHGRTAEAFVAYVAGPAGQAVLRRFGFLPPA
ncbi:MAG: modA [Acidimicrobiales bacterium]|nr:modA [Acidimicrobiales bacterium]